MHMGCTLLLAVAYLKAVSTQLKIAAITRLTARLSVERGAIKHYRTIISFHQTLYFFAIFNQSDNLALLC